MEKNSFSHLIRAGRIERGISQEAAARAVGCSLSAWIKWERGENQPSGPYIRPIATALNMPIEKLLPT